MSDDRRRPCKVLVADDELVIVSILERFLVSRGYDVVSVSNGGEVLDRVRAEQPQVILLDIRMPGRDGLMVLRDLQREFPRISVIMLTAASDDFVKSESLVSGASDYLIKPFKLKEVEQLISRWIPHED